MKVKCDSHMSSKTAKKRKPRPSTEFGSWLFDDSDQLYDYGCAEPLRLSHEEEIERCWLHRELNIGHEDGTYYSTEELRDFVRWNRTYDEEAVWGDIRYAYERRDEQLCGPFYDCYGWDRPDDLGYFDDFATPDPESLDERIYDALGADWEWKPLTKKRREADSTARNKRRDGSPRDKVGRSVDKACNHRLRRTERREWRLNLAGRVDPDQLSHPRGRTPASWDKSAW